jgi:hypothetical protein
MTTSLPRWVHRNLPRAAPPDSWQSLRSARVPPVHYLDKPLRLSLGATSHNPGVQFSMSKRVQFRMSVDSPITGEANGSANRVSEQAGKGGILPKCMRGNAMFIFPGRSVTMPI